MPARLSLTLLAATIAAALVDPAGATTPAAQTTALTTVATPTTSETPSVGNFVTAFSGWAGSTANARACSTASTAAAASR